MSTGSSSGNGQAFSKSGPQEKQVLLLLSDGRTSGEIARPLFLGEGTIRNYVNSILSELELLDQAAAMTYAKKHNLRGHLGM